MTVALLSAAVRSGNQSEVKKLIAQNIDPNGQHQGLTALHVAVQASDLQMVQMLCDSYNVDESIADPHGEVPLDLAKNQCRTCAISMDIVGYLSAPRMKRASKKQPPPPKKTNRTYTVHPDAQLRNAAQVGDEEGVRAAIAAGGDVHGRNEFGATALHLAVSCNFPAIARLLVREFKADVSMAKNWGDTPLHWACAEGHTEMVETLVCELGADFTVTNHAGATPLHFAAYYGQFDTVRLLVEDIGADVNAVNHIGKTVLEMSMIEENDDETLNLKRKDVSSYLTLLLKDEDESDEERSESEEEPESPDREFPDSDH